MPDFAAVVETSALNGANGFQISGEAANALTGFSVSNAGDVNGDGIGDLILGARGFGGGAYVVFGRTGAFPADLGLATLNGTNGFQLSQTASGAVGFSVSNAGDINGDGVADIVVGAHQASPNGFSSAGAAYVIYGIDVAISLVGTAADDSYQGTAGGDTLSGAGGRDTLRGQGGADSLDGGDMSDVLYGGGGGDILYGEAGVDQADGGVGNDKLFGGDDNDSLTGGDGNDQLDGGSGANGLTGGLGNDIYYVRNAADTVVELAGEGFDIVKATRSYVLADNIEALELLGGNWSGTGNALGNRITGSAGANVLSGEAGNDLLFGGAGDDTLMGGVGRDQLTGRLGADTFVLRDESIAQPVLEIDQILDFNLGEGDRLNLMAVDADTAADGDQAFTVAAALNGQAGQLFMFYTAGQDVTTLRLDVDGDGHGDYQLRINGDLTGSTDWLLL